MDMLEFAHAFTGAVIASRIVNPWIALPLAFLSHFAIDLLPHWNFRLSGEKKKLGRLSFITIFWLFMDSFIGLFLGLSVAAAAVPDWPKAGVIVMGAFLAVSPDLIEAPFFLFNHQNKYITKLVSFQNKHQNNVPFWPGIIFQIFYVGVLLVFL